MADLPSGTVTFLFTDIEGSTRLWEQHPQAMAGALARHDAILRQAVSAAAGVVYTVIGDAFQAAFPSAPLACAAALEAQHALTSEAWGVVDALPVRMALHTCMAVPTDGDYRTGALNRLGRLLGVVYGGQIVLSRSTADLVYESLPPDVTLRDLGEHHLRDLRPEHIFQLVAPNLPADFPPLKTLARHLHNLPLQPTALIGREHELVTLCGLLHRPDVRLVTLTGPGGTGKTRLGLQIAAELLDDFKDGVWFVNLAPISDPTLVAATVAQTLGIKEQAGRALSDSLRDLLREKQLLLLLDNFEQVVKAAPLVSELLAAAPGLNMLATSRIPLHLSGEREFAVAPLGLPPRSNAPQRTSGTAGGRNNENMTLDPALATIAELTQYAAVQLFIERAQSVKADFAVTSTNAPAIAEICYQLDGLPLAIELAAARVKLFPPQALLPRLSSRLTLLTAGARDLPARHQTIRDTIDWSYQLLDAGEQRLFACLGVFVGGWSLDAAEVVCNVDGKRGMDIVDGIAALLEQSLVRQAEGQDGEPRFTMLETIREYALEQLIMRGEADALRERHAMYYVAFPEHVERTLWSTHHQRWMQVLEREHHNLLAALTWSLSSTKRHPLSVRLAAWLGRWWFERAHNAEAHTWLERVLIYGQEAGTAAVDYAQALYWSGKHAAMRYDPGFAMQRFKQSLALYQTLHDLDHSGLLSINLGRLARDVGDYARAEALETEALAHFRARGDTANIALACFSLGDVALDQGDLTQATMYFREGFGLAQALNDAVHIGAGLLTLGRSAYVAGSYAQARDYLGQCLAHSREHGIQPYAVLALIQLGQVARAETASTEAAAVFVEALELLWELRTQYRDIAFCLEGLGGIAGEHTQPEAAARLLAAAAALRERIGVPLPPVDRPVYERDVAAARALLDETAFVAAWAEGRALTMEQAIAEALEPLPEVTPPTAPPLSQPTTPAGVYPTGLTRREVEVLRLIAEGLTDAQVAERLVISGHTVHAHLRAIYGKLEVTSRTAATRFAVDHQLV